MELNIPELAKIPMILCELQEIKCRLAENNGLEKAWYTDEECNRLKGGCTLSTYRKIRYYQCKGGIPDAYISGRKVWSRDSVIEWLSVTDNDLPEYHEKYKTGAKK